MTSRPDRRSALTIAATVGISPAVLAACGGDEDGTDSPDELARHRSHSDAARLGPADQHRGSAGRRRADLPDQQVVVTQPAEGEFKCFTAVLHPHGLHRQLGAGRRHPLRVPRQRLLDRGRHAGEPARHSRWTRWRSPSKGDQISIDLSASVVDLRDQPPREVR